MEGILQKMRLQESLNSGNDRRVAGGCILKIENCWRSLEIFESRVGYVFDSNRSHCA